MTVKWLLVVSVWVLLSSPPRVLAQQKVDCSKVSVLACTSFNELIDAKNSDVIASINTTGKAARVCFVDGEDNFSILSFELPRDRAWRKEKDGLSYSSSRSVATFKRYKDGVADDNFLIALVWHKIGEDGDPTADGKGIFGELLGLHIDSDESVLTTEWRNKAKTTTTFRLSIRIATGRFKETYGWTDAKGTPHEESNAGHCLRYQDGRYDGGA